jgi:hypothetical protein
MSFRNLRWRSLAESMIGVERSLFIIEPQTIDIFVRYLRRDGERSRWGRGQRLEIGIIIEGSSTPSASMRFNKMICASSGMFVQIVLASPSVIPLL